MTKIAENGVLRDRTDDEERAYNDKITRRAERKPLEDWAALRTERNRKLVNTDWWATTDLTITQDQKDYRKALRDLPANTADPTNITWPEEPGA